MSAAGPGGAEPVRIVIADDHAVYRRGLRQALGADPTIAVVAEADDGLEAIAQVEELVPDVVLMDIRMPRLNGIDAAREIRTRVPSVRVVMLTVSEEEDDLFEAIKAGANGYLLKELPAEDIATAIRAVANGDSLITPSMASKLLREFSALATRAAGAVPPARDREAQPPAEQPARARGPAEPMLSPRELEVLTLVAEGLSNRSVADQLYISENTVKNHMGNILEKLQLHSRTEAVMYAVRRGLFDPHQSDPNQTDRG
jgi:two-component system NarL family response regulator